ncbi:winged helix-turn-helix transcriptional regulator [Candidatus Bathyarchaeota archaeon]|nr:winged helix-turn-helix transcriptional regulator [Candidatus Bathyarchaeota archaeon]
MDNTDIILLQLLLANSRLSYGKLAEKLGLSVNSVHKRIQSLIETGVIHKFTAKLGPLAANFFSVFISGTSQLSSFQDLPDKLNNHGSIYWLAIGGGKYLYIGAYLRRIDELEPLVRYIKTEAGMPEPTVGIMSSPASLFPTDPKPKDLALYDLDYKIIGSLKDNSRKPVSDVADELGVSAKTVRRRLSRMIKNFLIELSLEWYPDASNDIITLFDVSLKPDADLSKANRISQKYSPNMLFSWSFMNIPGVVTCAVWTNTMKELQSIRENLEKEVGVLSAVPNILYVGYIFKTWRDQMPEKQ